TGSMTTRTACAEFIRLQCQIARLAPDDDRLSGLVARECRIYAAHSRHWHSLAYPKFRRGFVEEATLTRADLQRGLDGLFAAHPLRSLWIVGLDPDVQHPGWRRHFPVQAHNG